MDNFDEPTKKFIETIVSRPTQKSRSHVLGALKREHTKDVLGITPVVKKVQTTLKKPMTPDAQRVRSLATFAASVGKGKSVPASAARALAKDISLRKEGADPDEVLEAHPLRMMDLMDEMFDREWVEWEPETIREEVSEKANWSETAYEAVFALQVCLKTNFPLEMWHIFENVGHALNNNVVMYNHITPLEIHECAFTLAVLKYLRKDQVVFPEVCGYIASCAMQAGLVVIPPSHFPKECQDILDELSMDKDLKMEVVNSLDKGSDDEVTTLQIEKMKEILDYVRINMENRTG